MRSVAPTPKFEGLKMCWVRPGATGARINNFDAMERTTANTIGERRSFGYRSIAQAKPGMRQAGRKLANAPGLPRNRIARPLALASTQSNRIEMAIAVAIATTGVAHDCSKPR